MTTSNIYASVVTRNNTEGLNFTKSQSFIANEKTTSLDVLKIASTSALVDFGDVITPKYIAVSNSDAADSVLISFDNTNFDQEVQPGESLLIRLRNSDKQELQTVTTIADSSGSLNAKYFTLEGYSGTWAVWFDIDNSGTTEPAHGKDHSVKISGVVTDSTASQVALIMSSELIADASFSLDFLTSYNSNIDDDLVTIRDNHTGNRTDINDAGSTGFTVATTQDGGSQRAIYLKSSNGEITTLVGVFPN
tara:strand:- start:2351 stop:3097 length:747 start_codon:yes stop_codon:yes gene_type:complete